MDAIKVLTRCLDCPICKGILGLAVMVEPATQDRWAALVCRNHGCTFIGPRLDLVKLQALMEESICDPDHPKLIFSDESN